MSVKIGFLFLVPADLALICWLKVETFLNDRTYGKPSSRVVPAYPQLFCNSANKATKLSQTSTTQKFVRNNFSAIQFDCIFMAPNLATQFLVQKVDIESFAGSSFGQRRPPLTELIASILVRYPDGGQILKVIN